MRNRERLRFGVTTHGGPLAVDELRAVSAAVGQPPSFVLWFEDFHAEVPVAAVEAVNRMTALPILTWEPWRAPLASIVDGGQDDHVIRWADALRDCQSPVYLRFGHEFNGDWYPWTPAHGTSPDLFQAAWRHLHEVFQRQGATNVLWVWCPNAVSAAGEQLITWYPGDQYVDVLAVDGYNWGSVLPVREWVMPENLFDPALVELRAFNSGKPILIAEVACAEHGGSKAEWISELVSYLAGQPDVDGFVWFEHDKETDWRLASSRAATAAMAGALEFSADACGAST
jgi:mannan endo-1,4-beta-mannosidase